MSTPAEVTASTGSLVTRPEKLSTPWVTAEMAPDRLAEGHVLAPPGRRDRSTVTIPAARLGVMRRVVTGGVAACHNAAAVTVRDRPGIRSPRAADGVATLGACGAGGLAGPS